MPISIYKEKTAEKVAWICEDFWDLPSQIDALESWIAENALNLPKDKYIADIGFDIRPNASGGGAVLNNQTMKLLSDNGFDLFLSEYPNQLNETE